VWLAILLQMTGTGCGDFNNAPCDCGRIMHKFDFHMITTELLLHLAVTRFVPALLHFEQPLAAEQQGALPTGCPKDALLAASDRMAIFLHRLLCCCHCLKNFDRFAVVES
jgi:hypothetical protein